MTKSSKTIIFFGSGPVAARSLQLLAKNFTIEAVVTKPRPPHHRGETPVLTLSEQLKLRVVTVSTKEELSTALETKPFASELGVLIDFGIIIGQDVIDYFPLGIINSHFSVLPDLRGADPISFALLSGQSTTGVSLMQIVEAMDEGPLLAYTEQPLDGTETTPSLTEQLILVSDALLTKMIPEYVSKQLPLTPQSVTGRKVTYSHKLSKIDGVIDWRKPAVQLEREVRAYAGWPRSRTILGGSEVIVTAAHVDDQVLAVGEINTANKQLVVGTTDASLSIDRLQPAGKTDMPVAAFLAGNRNL